MILLKKFTTVSLIAQLARICKPVYDTTVKNIISQRRKLKVDRRKNTNRKKNDHYVINLKSGKEIIIFESDFLRSELLHLLPVK